MEEALVEAGMMHGVQGLLAATALMGIGVSAHRGGDRGQVRAKWALGLHGPSRWHGEDNVALYLKRFAVKFIRPVIGRLGGLTGLGLLGWLAGPAGLVISLGTLLLLAPTQTSVARQARGDRRVPSVRRIDFKGQTQSNELAIGHAEHAVGPLGELLVVGDQHDGLAQGVPAVQRTNRAASPRFLSPGCPKARRPTARSAVHQGTRATATRCCSPPEIRKGCGRGGAPVPGHPAIALRARDFAPETFHQQSKRASARFQGR